MTIDVAYYQRAAHDALDQNGQHANITLPASTLLALLDHLASAEAHRDVLMEHSASIAQEREALQHRLIQAGLLSPHSPTLSS
jgi:hypothetical protein